MRLLYNISNCLNNLLFKIMDNSKKLHKLLTLIKILFLEIFFFYFSYFFKKNK